MIEDLKKMIDGKKEETKKPTQDMATASGTDPPRVRASEPQAVNNTHATYQQTTTQRNRSQQYQDVEHANRIRQLKANCIIIFNIPEETDNIDNQRDIDRFHTQRILSDLDLEHFEQEHIFNNRVGRQDENKIRPLRVQFKNEWVRERIIERAFMMRYSLTYCGGRYPKGVFINRDLTIEGREKEKNEYIVRKQQKTTKNPDTIEETTDMGTNNDTRNENNTAHVTRDQVHPQGAQGRNIT